MPGDHGRKRPTRPVPKPNAAQFTDALRQLLRHEARLKVVTIAAATKVSKASVSRYVLGQSLPPSDFVDNAVTAALERLNGNSTYVTVDVYTELCYWQAAWGHAERTRYSTTDQQSRTPPDAEPAAPSAPLYENGWRKVRGAVVTIGSVIAAAYTSARIGVSAARSASQSRRPSPEPAKPVVQQTTPPAQNSQPAQEEPSSEPQEWLWKPTPVCMSRGSTQGPTFDATQPLPPTRRQVWTYSNYVRKNNN